MEYADIGGTRMAYRIVGKGPNIAWTPGGWAPGDAMPALVEFLSERFQVLVYDRPNSGASGLVFDESASEWEMAADLLHGLVGQLGLGPLYVAGASGGAMLSLLYAHKYGRNVKGLFLSWPPLWISEFWAYCAELRYDRPARVVEESGMMAALLETKADHWLQYNWATLVSNHPENRERLLSFDPGRFAGTMRRWGAWFRGRPFAAGLSDEDLGGIHIPTAVMPAASGDDYHPESSARMLAQQIPTADFLRNAEYLMPAEAAARDTDRTGVAACVARFFQRVEHTAR